MKLNFVINKVFRNFSIICTEIARICALCKSHPKILELVKVEISFQTFVECCAEMVFMQAMIRFIVRRV